ncbi:M20/M25/M40 family metallo-hydrolase [uncultured Oscillibacter sp.]|uniref:M20/M25/M40 family metallo-hydrolase n=1 Tax=uncultured Oscillibacter sp. TaxID=876091 RepID=UPI002804C51B|nr:M20/M25/M40 family metallo-hydrolase [uncultured Oscillibacter sp.]
MSYTDAAMLQTLQGLLRIPSVSGHGATPAQPYGKEVDEALDHTLALCRSLGMKTVKLPGKTAWAEIGQGDELIAVVPHLDVVPAGEGWTVAPFDGTVRDGRIYGRGSSDNKGPAVACIYAAADVLEALRGALPRRLRLIFGQSEETGLWPDMDYYRTHEETPLAGFTPDAEFPALSGEKGMLWAQVSLPRERSGLCFLHGGTACNIVAAQCEAAYPGRDGTPVRVSAAGRAAHATVPDQGVSAIDAVMQTLRGAVEDPLVAFYETYLSGACHGEKLAIDCADEPSGRTTLCAGMVRTTASELTMTLDIRYPVTGDGAAILASVERAAGQYGLGLTLLKNAKPLYRPKHHPILQQVLAAYREETGDLGDPIVIGGGTYARGIDNIVGFGGAFPGHVHTEHQADEYMELADFYQQRRIYRSAMLRLLRMDGAALAEGSGGPL